MAQKQDKLAKKARRNSFFRGVKSEYKKINWPDAKTLLNYSAVVIVVSLIVSLIVVGLDKVFHTLVSLLVR